MSATQSGTKQTHWTTCSLPCVHCGLATSCTADTDPQTVFCCNGCLGAYQLIHGWGLDDFYALRDQVTSTAPDRVRTDQLRFNEFDREEFLGRSKPIDQPDGRKLAELAIHGLHCGACAWLIENAAARTPGWESSRVKMSDHTIRVSYDPAQIPLSRIAALLAKLGYEVAPLTDAPNDHFWVENRRLLTQIAIAGFCAANAMWIAIGLYAGEALGIADGHRLYLRLIGTLLGLLAVVVPGRTFFTGAMAAIRTRTPHMDLPVALGLSVGTIAGVINAVTGRGDVYFDSLAVLVFLLLLGRWIQFRQQHRAAQSVDLLMRITPQHARRINADGSNALVPARTLEKSDRVLVLAGESIPVDGEILQGDSMIDRSLLTGESKGIAVGLGDAVAAGTVNLMRPIEISVDAVGADTRIGQVMQSVEAAAITKTSVVQLADRIGGVFVVSVTLLSIATLLYWGRESWGQAMGHATALLIVACPCALALATPLAIAVAIGRSAKRRILVRDGQSMQHLSRPGMIWFDKTGTLTEGRMRAEFVDGCIDSFRLAASVETQCVHPIAEALVAEAKRQEIELADDAQIIEIVPGGIVGRCDDHAVAIGGMEFMTRQDVAFGLEIHEAVDRCLHRGTTPILIAIDGIAKAVMTVSDKLKADAVQTIDGLKQRGWQVGILSGDHSEIVRRVAAQLNVQSEFALGGLSPEEKLQHIKQGSSGRVVMVGDGANDAAALAAADIGIAVRGGAEVSLQAAPVFISSGHLNSIVELVDGSQRTRALILSTFAVSLGYNVIAVALAMTGYISPLVAAVLMPISSVSVLTLTLLWPIYGKEPQ
ncbi:MAG: heavy metal translocating P-type ATPase metal-binding domain-containing protein [Pirellulaceae bacterium]